MFCKFTFQLFFIIYVCFAQNSTVNIPQGTLQGIEISVRRTQKIYAYLGIPYAQPPLEKFRFAPPQVDPLPSWDEVKVASKFAPACLQAEEYKPEEMIFMGLITNSTVVDSSEDCLYLNVYVPYGRPPPGDFATIVWIHPGNFTSGSPNMWNPFALVHRQGVIFVTIAYRLNIMGFFTSLDAEVPGNVGLLDQQAALKWVKNNIKQFGGNPDKICLMGYGAGGISVALHMVNSDSRGLFSSAIVMSASLFNTNTLRTGQEDSAVLDALTYHYSCHRKPSVDMVQCLQRQEGKELVKFSEYFHWRPLIESPEFHKETRPFITEPLKNYFARGDFVQIPILTGYTNMEYVLRLGELIDQNLSVNTSDEYLVNLLPEIANWNLPAINDSDGCSNNLDHITDSIMFYYKPSIPIQDVSVLRKLVVDYVTDKDVAASIFQFASYMANKNQDTFMYRFDMKPSTTAVLDRLPDWASVPHLFDLVYVWGLPYWSQLPNSQEWDARDRRNSDIIMHFWTNFAKFSNPIENFPYAIRWTQFTTDNPGMLIVDRTFNMSDPSRVNYKTFEFWNDYFPKVVEVATQCCNATDGSNSLYHTHSFRIYLMIHLFVYYVACNY